MNISAPFIKRPKGTSLIALGIAIAGIISFNFLPVSSLPEVDFPTINVQGGLPGASASIMASSVAAPLEHQLGNIAGVTEMTSTSSLGNTRVTLQFDLSRNIDGAARDVQAAINEAASYLPANLPNTPTYRKVNPADAPILIISLTSETYTQGQMYDIASTILEQKISQIDGVGQVVVGGSSLPGVRVELNPFSLNEYGIDITQVANTINNANVNSPKGQLLIDGSISDIMTNDQLFLAKEYAPLIIAYNNNSPVRLSDVAEVVDSVEDLRNAGLSNGKPSVFLVVYKEPGANVIETVDDVTRSLNVLKSSIPAAIDTKVMMDRTVTIRASLLDIEITLIISMFLVILVTYVFLGNVRAMLIPGVAVALSLLGTCCMMRILGFGLDNLSLMALTIATGFVVDDAVVVLENTSRHLENRMTPVQAALLGAQEVGFTVLSMSISLIAVFIPILFMSGILGRLFREFSLTLAIAILMSLLISLTITPMMCSQLLRIEHIQNDGNRFTRAFERLKVRYGRGLEWSLGHPGILLSLLFVAILLNVVLFSIVPKGFFPQQDTGRITGAIQSDQNISFQALSKKLKEYVSIVQADPGVLNVVGTVGGTNSNSGSLYITLKALGDRKISSDAIINRLRPHLDTVPGASVYLQSAQDVTIGGRQSNAQYLYSLSSDNLDELNAWSPKAVQRIATLHGIADVSSDQRDQGLQMFVDIDRDAASRYGITVQQLDNTLYNAFGQSQVSTMYKSMNQYHVVMEVAPEYWQYPSTLDKIYVTSDTGQQVPLSAIAKYSPSNTLLLVNHQGTSPAATISFNLLRNVSLGDAVSLITRAMIDMKLPATIHGSFQGTAQAFQDSLSTQVYLICAALVAVYIILGILYENLIHPITILSTLPSAGVGALLALILMRLGLDIVGLIGILLLIGLVKKNAIMMIDFAMQIEKNENKTSREAIYEAALLRFRPIMMTSAAALFGAIPLMLGFGLGAEMRQPLGVAIVGGLIVSQLLTIFTTPVIYLEMDKLNIYLIRKWKRTEDKTV